MAPPTRHRPHLDDLLQKNLELEHVVADLRHQLTQSFAKWADERKTLATGCDALMASFAKFRARLDVHSSEMVDLEEIEENLDSVRPSEEVTGEVDDLSRVLETDLEANQASSVAGDFRESLTAELHVREEELENSRRRHEAAEDELRRVQRTLEIQSKQLQAALSATKTDTTSELSPERIFNDASIQVQVDPPEAGSLEEALDKLRLTKEELNRFKVSLTQWKKYGTDWKRDAQSMRARLSESTAREKQLKTELKAAEENMALLETEKKENQRLTTALADQTAALDHQRTIHQESLKRIHDLEATVLQLRTQPSPEQPAPTDSGQKQAAPDPPSSTKTQTARTDTDTNKQSQKIHLRIPLVRATGPRPSVDTSISGLDKSVKQPIGINTVLQNSQPSQARASSSTTANLISQTNNTSVPINPSDFELCIHTCNVRPCRNESHSILWRRKQASLPRHALSAKKHHRCNPACPGHRLLMMPVADALKEPRKAKCRPPTDADLAMAAVEVDKLVSTRKKRIEKAKAEEETRREGSGESEGGEESGGSDYEEGGNKMRVPMKRLLDDDERPRKLRPRVSK